MQFVIYVDVVIAGWLTMQSALHNDVGIVDEQHVDSLKAPFLGYE